HHVRLPTLDAATCQDEIAGCKTELEQITGAPVHHFCYPYGEYTAGHVAQVAQAGYASATTTQRGRCQSDDSLLELPRVPVLRRTSRPLLWWKLASNYEDRRRA
ncbi:MAG: polysaccharide deacetylase family protein, partial [Rhodoferax sp.]